MFSKNLPETDPSDTRMRRVVWLAAVLFALAIFRSSAARWADFGYETFDLAFYVQALWKLVQGHGGPVSLLNVPLLGEHANVIVLFLVPLAALIPHPLLPVAVQVLAVASMGPVAYRIARRLGLQPEVAALMALAALLTPATGFVALHEFHPEALTAPFLLLAIDAFQRKSLPRFWLWFLATLACKENMTLLLALWCGVNLWSGWRAAVKRTRGNQRPGWDREGYQWALRWCIAPGVVALGWAVLWAGVLSPRWNGGNIDFAGLYGQLTTVPLRELPHAVLSQLSESLLQGNLIPGLLLPLCGLSLLRPRWLLVAVPVLAQHLLSFRPSEWIIAFHYPAPLLPLVWVAACEALAGFSSRGVQKALGCAVAVACFAGQIWKGPARKMFESEGSYVDVEEKRAIVASVPPNASVVAGLPFLSHLAQRDQIVSLHHLLKGLKTLSLKAFEQPPPGDVVIVDYADMATFDPGGGYYHPAMRVQGGLIVPSSDVLLHNYLRRAAWTVESRDSLTVFRRKEGIRDESVVEPKEVPPSFAHISKIDPATALLRIAATPKAGGLLQVESLWRFSGERQAVPWMMITLVPVEGGGAGIRIHRGLCAPEGWNDGGIWTDRWTVPIPPSLAHRACRVEVVFFDNSKLRWDRLKNPKAGPEIAVKVSLGTIQIP